MKYPKIALMAIALLTLSSPAHADDDDVGMTFLKCFHPTGKYDRITLEAPQEMGGHTGRNGRIFFRGALSGSTYYMRFVWESRQVEGSWETKVTPGEDTAPFPANPRCRLRNWTGS
jgi:hypothetical protein